MLRTIRSACRNPAKNIVSALALAIAAAGAVPAAAQDAAQPDVSEDFVSVYQPVQQVVNAPDGDIRSVAGQFDTIARLADTADEKYFAGQLIYSAGQKLDDKAIQIQGVQLQIDSGKLEGDRLPRGWWTLGNLAFDTENWQLASDAFTQAAAAGYTTNEVAPLIAESMWNLGNAQGGLDVLSRRVEEMAGAGQSIPQQWLLRGLQVAYNNQLPNAVGPFAEALVTQHTSQRSWMGALQVINAIGGLDEQSRLDLMRLMRKTDSMSQPQEYQLYITAADPRIMSHEVSEVLADALSDGLLTADDPFYVEVKGVVDSRLETDRAEAPELVADARAEAGGEAALIAGNLLYSLSDYAGAEEMFAMALDKGGVDASIARTRLGIAQVQQGKFAEAQANFDQVSGSLVARMWSAYAETQSA